MAKYYPIFLNLEGRRCLVVGAGKVAVRKVGSLIDAGARVEVLSPKANKEIESWADEGRISLNKKEFEPWDLEGFFLVIGATGDREVNRQIFKAAEDYGMLANIVDDPELCNFYLPAVVQRGEFQLAISTGGASPMLARRVREDLEGSFGSVFGELAKEMAVLRNWLREKVPDIEKRKVFWDYFVDLEFFRQLDSENISEKLMERAQECLSRLED